jgi:hypothetical protein
VKQLSLLAGIKSMMSASVEDVQIRGETITVTTPEGVEREMPLADLLEADQRRQDPFRDVCWPDGVRHVYVQWPMAVVVLEIPPARHMLKWIRSDSPAPYGPGCQYAMRRVSLPWIIMMCTFAWHPGVTGDGIAGGMRATQRCEVYFRTDGPLRSMEDGLLIPALKNCSVYRSREAPDPCSKAPVPVPTKNQIWYCTQHLPLRPYDGLPVNERMRQSVTALREYLLLSGFNNSDGNSNPVALAGQEGPNTYDYTISYEIDDRIVTIERWEAESIRDPNFIFSVPFIPARVSSVREVAERILREFNVRIPPITSAADLARLVLNRRQSAKNMQIAYPHALWPTAT